MGIYYYAIDRSINEFFESPADFSIKSPGIFHYNNPFPNMVVMMNSRGGNFEIENDCGMEIPDGCKCITEKVYAELLAVFPDSKTFYEPEEDDPAT